MIDPIETPDAAMPRWRRRHLAFRQRKIPIKFLVPNFFTLLSLCAGVTAIRMAIEGRYDFAVWLVVAAALIDGIDGRLARALKAQSRFGAELDSLADFVNFGVAPAIVVFTWGLGGMRGLGWIAALVFASGMALRLARFNSMLDVDKPKWQSNYFTGIPAPAGAITVLLPLYLEGIGISEARHWPLAVSIYTLIVAGLLVSTIPTFSGKLLGERISRDYVLPVLVAAALMVALLVTYPYATLLFVTVSYLSLIPFSYRAFHTRMKQWTIDNPAPPPDVEPEGNAVALSSPTQTGPALPGMPPTTDTKH